MRAVTWTQVAQYIVLIIAYLVPVFWMSNAQDFGMIPQFSYGGAVERISELEAAAGVGQLMPSGLLSAFAPDAPLPLPARRLCQLAICYFGDGVDVRHGVSAAYSMRANAERARCPSLCGLFAVLYFPALFHCPALATFKLQILDPNLATGIIGKSIADVQSLEWIQKWSNVGFLAISGNGVAFLEINEFFMRGDIVVLATPEIAGLPVISGWSPPVVWLLPCPGTAVACHRQCVEP